MNATYYHVAAIRVALEDGRNDRDINIHAHESLRKIESDLLKLAMSGIRIHLHKNRIRQLKRRIDDLVAVIDKVRNLVPEQLRTELDSALDITSRVERLPE